MIDEQTVQTLFHSYQGGRFTIDRILGAGGMGTVVKAYDNRLKVPRAIKIFNPELNDEVEMRKRFEDEASVMSQIEHTNIVRVFDSFEIENYLCIVLEWMDGGTLSNHVFTFGALPPRQAVDLMITMCDALAAAHARGVIHRDIKPDNILFTANGVPKVADFGIAHIDENSIKVTGDSMTLGTLGYMGPEQMSDAKNVDVRADVHAIGVTLWVALTGKAPPSFSLVNELENKPHLWNMVPEDLRSIIRKAIDYDPAKRYRTIEALSDVLEGALIRLPQDPPNTPELGSAVEVMIQAKAGSNSLTPNTAKRAKPAKTTTPRPNVLEEEVLSSTMMLKNPISELKFMLEPKKETGSRLPFIVAGVVALATVGMIGWMISRNQTIDVPTQIEESVLPIAEKIDQPIVIIAQEVSETVVAVPVVVAPTPSITAISGVPSPRIPMARGKKNAITKTTDSPEPEKKWDVPKPITSKVSVGLQLPDMDTARVWLVGTSGKIKLPGSVAPGVYRVVASFKDHEGEVTVIPSLKVVEDSKIKLVCNSAFANCKAR